MADKGNYHVEATARTWDTIHKLGKAEVMPDLRRELRVATDPIVPTVRREAMRIPVKTPSDDSLRRAIAKTIKRKFRVTLKEVFIAVQAIPQGGKSNIVRAVEGEIPWQHPTFGHDPKVTQEAKPFFYPTIEKFLPIIHARMMRVLDQFERKL